MTEPAPSSPGTRLPALLVLLAVGGATGLGTWLYLRARQPAVDERTRDRLAPRGRP